MNSAPDWGRGPARSLGLGQSTTGWTGWAGWASPFPSPAPCLPLRAPLNPFDHDRKRQRCEQPVCAVFSPETVDGADNLQDRIEDRKHTQRPTVQPFVITRKLDHQ